MKISVVAFTQTGVELCSRLLEALPDFCEGFAPPRFARGCVRPLDNTLREWTRARFSAGEALVFIGAAGIAVRSVAPFVRDKQSDPAVVSIDEQGKFAVPLLSGHIGGANALARKIAEVTGGTAVISTATDINGLWSPDAWAVENGCRIGDISAAKQVAAALLEGETVGLQSDFEIDGGLPGNLADMADSHCGVVISMDGRKPYPVTLNLTPVCLTVGVGCRKGVDNGLLEEKILGLLNDNRLPVTAVAALATIDRKAGEPAILAFCEKYRLPLLTYDSQELEAVEGEFSESRFVLDVVGTGNVCERAAVLAGGSLIVSKTTGDGVALAVAKEDWRARFWT